MSEFGNTRITHETLSIVSDCAYCVAGQAVRFPAVDFRAAEVLRLENPLVLNFANAHFAGGGFYLGANAQEESICRRSTLYASLKSSEAKRFYRENNFHIRCAEADALIYSPNVIIFRNQRNVTGG